LDILETRYFEARLDLELILKQDFVCWSNLVLILKQFLSFGATLFDSSLASSKSCIHTFTLSPFLMMTIIIKWFLFSIIKTCMIHILPLFYDDNHYQEISVGQVASEILRRRGWIKISLTIPNWKFPFLRYSLDLIISLIVSYSNNK